MITVGELLRALDLPAGGLDPAAELSAIAPLEQAGPGDLAFVAQKKYLPALRDTGAGLVLLREEWAGQCPVPSLAVRDPYLYYARASALFADLVLPAEGVHPLAVVDDSALIGAGVRIGPGVTVGPGAEVGDGSVLEAGVSIGAGARIGRGCHLYPNVVIYHAVCLGDHCIVHGATVIGSDGFGFARGPEGWEKIHQLGTVVVGDRVEIGSGCSIDRGALGNTVIADGVIIDNQVHIAHNVEVGERTAIAGCVGFAGSTTVGADCTFAGQVGIAGHLQICDNVHFTGQARVTRSIDEPGTYASGTPLDTARQWGRNAVRFSQLNELAERVKTLEAQLEALGDDRVKAGDPGADDGHGGA